MKGHNPYNCAIPGNLFVGYDRLRQELLNGFRNGRSYAILGGRRCGKTSLLKQLRTDLETAGLAPLTPVPRLVDIQALGRCTPQLLFHELYRTIVQDVDAQPFHTREEGREYRDFLAALGDAKALLDKRYGRAWVVILLIDELDAAISKLPDDQFFQNLRNLLMMSDFRNHFRVVASGVNGMAKLITSGCSPLNNLRNKYLSILSISQMHELVLHGFQQGLDPDAESLLLQLTGRHPYLVQGLLEKLYDAGGVPDRAKMQTAAGDFLREHRDFTRWLEMFGSTEHGVYQLLSQTTDGRLHVRDLRFGLDPSLAPNLDDALTVLSYHGVIDDSDPDRPCIAGAMFRDWYHAHGSRQVIQSAAQQLVAVRLFISYSHKDDELRREFEPHLAPLKRQGFIEVWHDRRISAGQAWEEAVDDNLEAAHMILLLISPEFVASEYCYAREMQRALDRHNQKQARVIPVIVRPTDWTGLPFSKLQALPPDDKAVTTWPNRDSAWLTVAQGIRRVVEELRKR
ncbi:hypothetical protein BH18ACI4_BH18ACI4_25920 [soil metagenome]